MASTPFSLPRRRSTSAGRFIGLCRDGSRLILLVNHRLDNTRQPRPGDFRILFGKEPVRVRAALLTSPMVADSDCAALCLHLSEPLGCEQPVSIHYLPGSCGLLSLVDKRPLAPATLQARCDGQGQLRLVDEPDCVALALRNGVMAALAPGEEAPHLMRQLRIFADNGWRYQDRGWLRRTSPDKA